ncbi:MAG: elongation factor G [Dehalococcoidia bacterium]|nr:elongation factor G [Dehalococcoidia bacterium]
MKQYPSEKIRNIVLLSHSGAGKTTLSEALLFVTGAINRLGKIEAGNTTSDYDPDEVKRHISINLSILPCEWHETKLNLIDSPGYIDFVGEVRSAVRVSEGAIIVVAATSGIEVGTELTWGYAEEAGLARMVFVSKMDRENANFLKVVEQFRARYGAKCVPLQLPVGSHVDFKGVVDLLSMKAFMGSASEEGDIPAEFASKAQELRAQMVEAVAETDDDLMEKYLGGEELGQNELAAGLKKAVAGGKIIPILVGSGLQNIGARELLNAIVEFMPSPQGCPIVFAEDSAVKDADISGPLSALVFKTTADPYVGKLTYFRVFTGAMDSNSQVWDVNQNAAERIGQLYMLRGKAQEAVNRVEAGDIGAVAKLSAAATGDTLGIQDKAVKLPPATFPKPIFNVAVHPKTKADLDKMGTSLVRLTEEDPTLRVYRDPDTAETILSGMGDTQVDVAAERMQRKFGVGVDLKPPKVPYRETITRSVKAEFKHKKQTGGHGQYGHVMLELEPLPQGSPNEFTNRVVGGAIPKNYIPAVEKGVVEGYKEGMLAGYPVVGIRVAVYDGSFHPVDSSEICFKIAGSQALKKGLAEGNPIMLEPIVKIKVTVPNDFTGDILSDLNTKRARVQGMNPHGDINTIEAEVPMAEMLRYATDLKSITQGRGTYVLELSHYEQVPSHITEKIIADREAEKAAEDK